MYGGSVATRSIEPPSSVGRTASASPTSQPQPAGSNPRGPPGSAAPRSASSGPRPSRSAGQVAHDLLVDRRPARLELDADGPPRAARDGRPEQRAADPGERVEHELARPAEELDQPGHQARRLVRAMGLARDVSELRWVGRREQRLGEVQPLLAGQLVERVGGVGRAPGVGHAAVQPSRRGPYDADMPARYTSARFVGREEAFADLAAALDDAAHGRARTVLIDGTAGIGVTPPPRRGDRPDRRPARADDRAPGCGLAGPRRRAVRPDRPGHRPDPPGAARRRSWPTCSARPRPRSSACCPTSRRASTRSAPRPAAAARPPRSGARRGRSRASSVCSAGSGSGTRWSS